ncbi:hypothetical protein GIB67_035790 [Kingdonia uniflora]|uniref:Uncharacterized protein n=1 Tax=Kingdonia uniflora TaxID=39325 RepID=A0A7J7MJH3_9MAGN|nr:hypothetical protein GIB67_035790 [Kingdonia uniflora]
MQVETPILLSTDGLLKELGSFGGQFRDSEGECLKAFAVNRYDTRLYLASHKVYGGEARLLSKEKGAKIEGKASLLAALDYYVSMQSEIFISTSPRNRQRFAICVMKHLDLRVRVVHGNTLTMVVILKKLPEDTEEIFLTGATSKLGRAIALYLCRHKVLG